MQYVTGGGARASTEWGIPGQLHITSLSHALLAGLKPAFPSRSQGAAGGNRRLLMAVRGHASPVVTQPSLI